MFDVSIHRRTYSRSLKLELPDDDESNMSHSDPLGVMERGMLSSEATLSVGLDGPDPAAICLRTILASLKSLSASELDPSYGSRCEAAARFLPLFAEDADDDTASELLESVSTGTARRVSMLLVMGRFNLFWFSSQRKSSSRSRSWRRNNSSQSDFGAVL